MNPIVIIGGGIAGYSLVKELRKLDSVIPIMLVTQDQGNYYFKPTLSNFFTGKQTFESLILMTNQQAEKKYSIGFRGNCKAKSIDVMGKILKTNCGNIFYSKLILACGASPRKLSLPGNGSEKVFSVNHFDDYVKFNNALVGCKRIVIIGSGLIGCEFANDLSVAGFEVTVVSPDECPLQHFIPKNIGFELKKSLSLLGVNWQMSTTASSIKLKGNGVQIFLNNGQIISTDLVLSAIGLEPNVDWAKKSGIKVNHGIITDCYLETSAIDIYSMGDCAEINGVWRPFIASIYQQCNVLSRTLLGQPTKMESMHSVVNVKTPIYPIVFSILSNREKYQLQYESSENGIKAIYTNFAGQIKGFILTGREVLHSRNFSKEMA